MATVFRQYPEVPVNVEPDVPHWVNLALKEVDKDMQAEEDRRTAADRNNLTTAREYADAKDADNRTAWAAADKSAAAAAKEYTDAVKWLRPPLARDTDLDTVTGVGLHPVPSGSVAASLLNAPPGFVNPGTVEVTPASATNGVSFQKVTMYWSANVVRTYVRQSLDDKFSGPWESEKSSMGPALAGTDWDTVLVPGDYSVESFKASATMTNLPPVPGGFAGTVTVRAVTSARVVQEAVEYATSSPGAQWVRVQAVGGAFGEWSRRPEWMPSLLVLGQDLNALFIPGPHRANTASVAGTVVGKPAEVVQPFTVTVTPLSTTNGVFMQEIAAYTNKGIRRYTRVSLGRVYPEAWDREAENYVEPVASRTVVTAFGDSLTAGGDVGGAWPAGASWPEKLGAALPGVTVNNRGRSGDSADEILVRAGAILPRFTVAGGSIPAEGTVALTTVQVLSIRDGRGFAGTFAGVYGTLRHVSGTDWTFTRAAAGSAVPAPGRQAFTSATNESAGQTLIYWAGRNDVSMPGTIMEPTQAEHIAAGAVRFMEWAGPRQKQVMIIGPTTGKHEPAGSPGHAEITEANRRLRELFPAHYASAQDYMVNRALADMGLTPTPADTAAQAAGEMPPSLIAAGDTLHFSQPAAANFAQKFVAPFLLGKGWV